MPLWWAAATAEGAPGTDNTGGDSSSPRSALDASVKAGAEAETHYLFLNDDEFNKLNFKVGNKVKSTFRSS